MSDVLISRDRAVEKITDYAEMYMRHNSFSMGAQLKTMAHAIAAIPGIGWKYVADEEPPEGHWVLGWRDGEWDKTRIFDHDLDGEAFWSGHVFAKEPPTHWMELPAEPEEIV